MRALLKLPGRPAEPLTIDAGEQLKQLQDAVGGYVEVLPIQCAGKELPRQFTVWMNEEGRLRGLPENLDMMSRCSPPLGIVLGPLVVTGPTDAEGEMTSLTDTQYKQALKFLTDRSILPDR